MQREKINTFLVNAFNTILQLEDRALSSSHEFSNLSVSEFHVIEAVIRLRGQQLHERHLQTAGHHGGITHRSGENLANKGYLKREKRLNDMRMVYVIPTEKGLAANEYHSAFHRKMVDAVMEKLPPEELDTLVSALEIVSNFFTETREAR